VNNHLLPRIRLRAVLFLLACAAAVPVESAESRAPALAHRAVGQVLPAAVGPIQELHFAKPFDTSAVSDSS
jgi:hypothetical protein